MNMCRFCGYPIRIVWLAEGKRLVLDAEPHPAGTVVTGDGILADGNPDAGALPPPERLATFPLSVPRYRPHFPGCLFFWGALPKGGAK